MCHFCGAKLVWSHAVDQTNGVVFDDDMRPLPGTVDYPLEQIGEEEETIVVRHPIYRIPGGP
jgi:hypothetical protein